MEPNEQQLVALPSLIKRAAGIGESAPEFELFTCDVAEDSNICDVFQPDTKGFFRVLVVSDSPAAALWICK
jgi:hypothetical protein